MGNRIVERIAAIGSALEGRWRIPRRACGLSSCGRSGWRLRRGRRPFELGYVGKQL